MPRKPKTNQPQTPSKVQGRDFFQTPNYAVDLLVPYIPVECGDVIWECASGDGKISQRLTEKGFHVFPTDIRKSETGLLNTIHNFLDNKHPWITEQWIYGNSPFSIITNPPFSLKYKFINKALEYDVPFAFLIPFDMCGQMAELFMKGCQGLVPTRRIDYITPTGLSGASGHTSYYHSFWLTYKFNLPHQLTFVELTKQMKENI